MGTPKVGSRIPALIATGLAFGDTTVVMLTAACTERDTLKGRVRELQKAELFKPPGFTGSSIGLTSKTQRL
jgi:hypothetical protein